MNILRRIMARRRRVVRSEVGVAEVEWHRNEELRPERLGPGPDDIRKSDESHDEPWRPGRTLGPF